MQESSPAAREPWRSPVASLASNSKFQDNEIDHLRFLRSGLRRGVSLSMLWYGSSEMEGDLLCLCCSLQVDDESGTGVKVKGIQRHPMGGPHVCRFSDWNWKVSEREYLTALCP